MLTVKSTINIAGQTVPNIIPAVQGDTGRTIEFTIADFTIPAGATATYYIQKPSGEAVYNAATISGNSVICDLTAQSLAEPLDNFGQVRIFSGGEVVTSFDFILHVGPFRGIEAIESTTEMNIFDEAVENAGTQIEEKAAEVIETIPADYTTLSNEVTWLKEELSVFNSFSVTWGQGNIIESNGASGGSGGSLYSKRLRTVLTPVPEAGFSVELPDNIQMQLFWYAANSTGSYIGCDTLGDISNLDSPRGAYVRFVLAYSDPTLAITPVDADVANVHLYTPALTDTSLTLSGKAADAKATGDAIRAAVPAVITVDVNGGADYTSLTKAIYDNVSTGETIMVKPGTYDIVQEYVNLFGQEVVDSLADSTDLGGFQYGIRVYNRKVIFQPGSHVVCDWTGHTVNGTHRFSAFSIAYNAEIEGLDLDCTATFYAIHDDYGTYQVYYKNIYRNCRLIGHNLVNQNVIGGGCKPYSRTIIDNCYVDNNATGTCVRYHNTNLSQAAGPVVWVSNSYFAQALSFRWYGTQTTKMTAYVNNCYASSITKGAEGSSTNDNVDLVTWNNETA